MSAVGSFFYTAASNALSWLWNALSGFFLVDITARRAAWYRILFGSVLLLLLLLVAHDPAGFFTADGAFPLIQQKIFAGHHAASLFYYLTDPVLTVVLYWVAVAATVAYILGFYPRVMLVIAWVIWLSLMQRTPFITNGADRALRALIFPLLFLDTSRALVPGWLQRFAPKQEPDRMVAGWPVRVAQIQVALIYLATFLFKWPYQDWQDGTYLFQLLVNPNYSRFDGYWLKDFPLLIIAGTYFALAGEALAAFFLFQMRTRRVMLLWLYLLHLGILLTASITYFSVVMFAALSLFIIDSEFAVLSRWMGTLLAAARTRTIRVSTPS